jgi:hypothetical protein
MNVKRSLLTAVMIAVMGTATSGLEAQDRPAHTPRQASGWLLENREALGLSEAQVTRLHEIAQQLEEQNRPLVAQLRTAGIHLGPPQRALSEAERREMHARLQEHRPTLQQLRENTHAAMKAAREVLTPAQLQRAGEMMRAHGPARGSGERGRAPRSGSGR